MTCKKQKKPMTRAGSLALPKGYGVFLAEIKQRIQTAQIRASLSASADLVRLYWSIGRDIVVRQKFEGWGSAVIERLAADIQKAFPGVKGFSTTNVWRMRAFFLAYHDMKFLPQPVGEMRGDHGLQDILLQIPWGHNVALVEQVKDTSLRLWYAAKSVEHGWSRSILEMQIESEFHCRHAKAITNFRHTLPPLQSDMAEQALKDPYVFDFMTLSDAARERETENALILHMRDFMIELGQGFAFVGSQVNLKVGNEDFYIDLLFYHLKLRCYVVIDLKTRPFIPDYAGKMNFYLSAVDDMLCHPDDQPSIGLILCKTKEKNRLVLEYALRDYQKPIGISQYRLTRVLPSDFKPSLPTVEEIEAELTQSRKQKGVAGRRKITSVLK